MSSFMRILPCSLLLVASFSGCAPSEDKGWGGGPSGRTTDDSTATDDSRVETGEPCLDTPCDSYGLETGCPESGPCDTGGGEVEYYFDEPGDYLALEQGEEEGYLGDESGDSNQSHQFYYVVVNASSDEVGFRLNYKDGPPSTESSSGDSGGGGGGDTAGGGGGGGGDGGGGDGGGGDGGGGDGGGGAPGNGPPPSSAGQSPGQHRIPAHDIARREVPPPPPLETTDIGSAFEEFLVRDDISDEESFVPVPATLWGVGEYVAIWVDNDVPIDWDYECDDDVDVYDASLSNCADGWDNDGDGLADSDDPDCGSTNWTESAYGTGPRSSFGLSNCHFRTISSIVDANIVVNFRSLFGDESDINNDGKISVLITPQLNALPLTSPDEDDHTKTIGSYAAPSIDLDDFDDESNPGSDEQEVIYVMAPDPVGFYNPNAQASVEEYTSQEILGQIAASYIKLIVYNQKVLVNESNMEEAWLMKVLSAVGADLVGFGAIFYSEAWTYLDAPYLYALTDGDSEEGGGATQGLLEESDMGAQYLFGRWLADAYGSGILAGMTQSDLTGTDSVVDATGAETFEALVVKWQVALLTTGVEDGAGSALVDPGTWVPYAEASTISAPTAAPDPPQVGVYYGANGHQVGFNLRGINRWMEGGTSDSPTENESRRTIAAGPDHHTYTPGYAYYGLAAENYGASIARLTQLPYSDTTVQLNGCQGECVGAIIRWPDISVPDTAVETIFSPLDANAMALPMLPSDGTPVFAIGDISDARGISSVESELLSSTADIPDLDRWLLDLTTRTPGEAVQVAVWLDRRFKSSEGEVSPYDPWIALAEKDWVPTPTVSTHVSDNSCADGLSWSYPSSMLEYLVGQMLLTSTAFSDDDEDYEPCGEQSTEPVTCANDWDDDGVSDSEELIPETFVQQVMVQQCTNNGSWPPATPYSADWIDQDEIDEDDQFSYSHIYNVGGQSGEEGEEALLYATLEGGKEYLLIVSGGDDIGTYELTMQQLN